jgi:hypothetical protein
MNFYWQINRTAGLQWSNLTLMCIEFEALIHNLLKKQMFIFPPIRHSKYHFAMDPPLSSPMVPFICSGLPPANAGVKFKGFGIFEGELNGAEWCRFNELGGSG